LSTTILSTTIVSAKELWTKVLSTEVWPSKVIQSFLYTHQLRKLMKLETLIHRYNRIMSGQHQEIVEIEDHQNGNEWARRPLSEVGVPKRTYTVDLGLVLPFYLVVLPLSE
jgi:hypothetical protein